MLEPSAPEQKTDATVDEQHVIVLGSRNLCGGRYFAPDWMDFEVNLPNMNDLWSLK